MADITLRISDKRLKIATVVIFGAIEVWLFAYLYASGAFVPTYRLSVYAPEVGGLSVGSPVFLDGVPVGTMDRVTLAGKIGKCAAEDRIDPPHSKELSR